ncbi:glycoside hydrolase family 2 protein [Rugosimonospora africana]|uniref:beta-mannosidase n=1 Tax=Rugosimonospora africana TaxID=556532 RepID=A0A8J3QKK3_9ACTN|nr:glycoside hydrolase family 2 protein [Rugosimonospora africana]GIH12690.1 beta-mannosidase [Rugosimonospora africana]
MSSYHPLHDGWTLTVAQPAEPSGTSPAPEPPVGTQPVPATVPGCVHTDLLDAGLIPDPFLGDNEHALAWIGRTDWSYRTTFDWAGPGDGQVDLVCAGLDTVATVTLNGQPVGRSANMHRQYRFPVADALRPGANELEVRFESAYRYAERMRDRLGDRPNAYPEPFNFIRKMACNFGWDWGLTLVTAGIWQPIGLHAWREARLDEVRPLVTVDGGEGRVRLRVRLERPGTSPVRLHASVSGHNTRVETEVVVEPGRLDAELQLAVADPRLWWPHGFGQPDRYDAELSLSTMDGDPLDSWRRRIGFRSVRLDTGADAAGSAYTIVVNDVPVFARGVNWIPDDALITRVDRPRYERRLRQALEANVNFVRVWGGGIYENDDFYDVADELGLMVGQDFPFACAAYPEEEPFASEVAAEAAQQIVRLAHHPSLLLWTGNNENLWGHEDWGWKDKLAGRTWGAGFYFEVLPDLMGRLDPTRPYWPGSPYSGTRELHPNDPAHGSMHIWDVWNTDDYTKYREYVPRFVAEFGYQAPPAYTTLRRAISDEPLTPTSPGMAGRQKAEGGAGKLARGLAAHLPEPRDFDDWHYLTQVNQARALSVGVEHFRSLRPVCMGAIFWQLNDDWPVISWSTVDADERRKPVWYQMRRSFAPRLLTIQPRDADSSPVLVAVNDSVDDWTVPVEVTRYTLAGEPRATFDLDLSLPAQSSRTVELPAELTRDTRPDELLRASAPGGSTAWWFFAEDRDIAYPEARFTASAEHADGAVLVTVTAQSILRDLTLFPDRLDPSADVDDALVTLLPGESATFTVRSARPLPVPDLLSRPVLRCVNDIRD